MNFTNLKNFLDHLTDWVIPGNVCVVYKDNQKVFEYSSGYSNLEKKIKMTGGEHLYIYSCSKPATVTAGLQLLEKGKILLSDPLYEYIPEFRDMYVKTKDGVEKAKTPITLQNLFTMTAGFSYAQNEPCSQKAQETTGGKIDNQAFAKAVAEDTLCFHPGTHWQYSICHDVLSAVIEVVSGKKFSQYVKENIFEPLSMTESVYHLTPEIEANMAEQYNYNVSNVTDLVELQKSTNRNGTLENMGLVNSHIFGDNYDSGGAGIITTANDYIKFIAALSNKGLGVNGERILSSKTVELMKTNQLSPEVLPDLEWPQLRGYGYGLGVRTMMDRAKGGSLSNIGEFGWGGAAGATVLADTDLNLAMFYSHHMCNPQEDYYQPRLRNVLYSCID